ncbi:MAG: hypothetical protein COB36_14890 [Alphaproteobacteria bacterium]|nr:MAG: hypothetical protein COB36_14890 [Alphaproteobacteria bacterium]
MKKALLFTLALALSGQAYSQPFSLPDKDMTGDERLLITFMTFHGATTYLDATGNVHSDIEGFSDNDIDLLRRSSNDYSYTKEVYKILNDVCDYYEATPKEDLDIEYLHSAPLSTNDLEESLKNQFLQNLYGQLSSGAKASFDQKMLRIHETSSGGRGSSYRQDVNYNDPEMIEAIIASTERSCPRIRASIEKMERNNWIEEPTSTAIMDVSPKGVEK